MWYRVISEYITFNHIFLVFALFCAHVGICSFVTLVGIVRSKGRARNKIDDVQLNKCEGKFICDEAIIYSMHLINTGPDQ